MRRRGGEEGRKRTSVVSDWAISISLRTFNMSSFVWSASMSLMTAVAREKDKRKERR